LNNPVVKKIAGIQITLLILTALFGNIDGNMVSQVSLLNARLEFYCK
jgi:hypothetical protein